MNMNFIFAGNTEWFLCSACRAASRSKIPLRRRSLHIQRQSRSLNIHRPSSSSASSSSSPSEKQEGYYKLLLDEPLPNAATATRLSPASTITRDASLTEKDNRIARARVIFGSRLAGPAQRREEIERQSTKIAGVLVPPRPEEPDNCCMSGCVSCVWDRYRDEMEEWAAKTTEARRRLSSNHEVDAATGAQRPAATLNTSTAPLAATSMDDDGGGSLANWEPTPPGEQTPVEDLFGGIPVGIREFMRIEKVLREKRAKQKSSAH